MKLFYTLLLLLSGLIISSHSVAQGQTNFPRYTGVYYRIIKNTPAYYNLSDTLPSATSTKPIIFLAKENLLVTGYPASHWAQGYKGGNPYYVDINSLVPLEKPLSDATQATIKPIEAPTINSTESSGHNIRTGPRGGRYYINSNGNKTYIKHK
jgi:hypothetical protein